MLRSSPVQLLIGGSAAVLLTASVLGFATRDGGDAGETASGQPGSVAIAEFRFNPMSAAIPVGGTVTWTNADDFTHNVTSSDRGPLVSGDIAAGASFEATFDAAGTYTYTCTLHPNMEGSVEVTG